MKHEKDTLTLFLAFGLPVSPSHALYFRRLSHIAFAISFFLLDFTYISSDLVSDLLFLP
jgi:hypothetical protein